MPKLKEVDINYEQIVELVRQLEFEKKIALIREVIKEKGYKSLEIEKEIAERLRAKFKELSNIRAGVPNAGERLSFTRRQKNLWSFRLSFD